MRFYSWGLLAGLGLAAMLAGCSSPIAQAPVVPPVGFAFEHVKAPLSIHYIRTEANPPKEGTARTRYVCGWPIMMIASFAWEDASIESAAKQGGINEVAYADYELFNVLGIYSEFTVHAYGK